MNFAKPRTAGTFEEAAMQLCVEVGSDELAKVIERSTNLIHKWTDEDSESTPNIKQAVKCDIAYLKKTGKEPPFFAAYKAQIHHAESEGASIKVKSILEEAMDIPGAIGILTDHLRHFLADGKLTPRERNELLKKAKAAHQQLEEFERAVKAEGQS